MDVDGELQPEQRQSESQPNTSIIASQCSAQTPDRRDANRQRMAQSRARESEEQRALRRERNRQRMAAARARENSEQTEARRISDRQRAVQSRSQEDSEQTAARRASNRQRTAQSREHEDEEQSESRRLSNRRRTAETREQENSEETEARRNSDRQRTAQSREQEDDERTAARRRSNRRRTAESREQENSEETEARRASNRQRTAHSREHEGAEQTTARRASDRMRTAGTRQRENSMEATERREANALTQSRRRQNESQEERENNRSRNNERQVQRRGRVQGVPIAMRPLSQIVGLSQHYAGAVICRCSGCGANFFGGEATPNRTTGTYNMCCNHGKVRLRLFGDYPQILKDLLVQRNINFIENIRSFNSAFAMASMVSKIVNVAGRGPYCFKVHGQVYHKIPNMLPESGRRPTYAQVYILDTQQAEQERMGVPANRGCDPKIMADLGLFFSANNQYAQAYRMMNDIYKEEEAKSKQNNVAMPKVTMVFHVERKLDLRRYNTPTCNEVAAVFAGNCDDVPDERSFVVHAKRVQGTSVLKTIRETDEECDPMSYPIFFPLGNMGGWHPNIKKNHPAGTNHKDNRVSQREHYAFYFSVRDSFNPIMYGEKLMQQYAVDAWMKTEQNRLNFARQNQKQLRAENYKTLTDFVNDGSHGAVHPGARIILPATYTGTARHMSASYQDAMAIVRKHGKPHYFITMTCNPTWKEITENLPAGVQASSRPDLISRVFEMKLAELKKDLTEKHILGRLLAYIYVIEFQKRGLPHCHMLLTMDPSNSHLPNTVATVDAAISAQLPDENEQPELFPMHEEGNLLKKFPKSFCNATTLDDESFPQYARPNNGRQVVHNGETFDNRHVVPYNAYLLLKYNCHINVEIVSLIQIVKYFYKYVYKGVDKANIRVEGQQVDEISEHLDARYICAPEALHRLFEFELQHKSHSVQRLEIHLPHEQCVVFEAGNEQQALEQAAHKDSTLMAFFKLNMEYSGSEQAAACPWNYFYHQLPEFFTFHKDDRKWSIRKGGKKTIGRMYTVSPKEIERYALRLLLLNRKGPKSFEDLRTVDGNVFPDFASACMELGLLQDIDHFKRTMSDAALEKMPSQLRSLFAAMLAFVGMIHAKEMWNMFKGPLSEDYTHHGYSQDEAEAHAFYDIEEELALANVSMNGVVTPPLPQRPPIRNRIDSVDHQQLGNDLLSKCNSAQEQIVKEVLRGERRFFFIDGPGGCGKTFVYNCVYHLMMAQGKKVICSAWTGIASTLLPNGRTMSSLFRLNIQKESRVSNMKPNSKEARNLKEIDVFIIDEISMVAHWVMDAIDQLLRDITGLDVPFGNKTFLIGGDFRQVLPVLSKESVCTSPSAACLKNWKMFNMFKHFKLTRNMRADGESAEWLEYLLKVGEGKAQHDENDNIEIPSDLISREDHLIDDTFEGDYTNNIDSRAILCPTNREVAKINSEVLSCLDGRIHVSLSSDSIESESGDDIANFPVEFLNKLTPNGCPPHRLELKEGAPVMVLRNLNVAAGLCNGTRLTVVKCSRNIILCRFISGPRKGEIAFIPRIDFITNKGLSFNLRRHQFPIQLAFAMTINKSQGQSLSNVGILLNEDVFGHGMLYVALSRCTTRRGIKCQLKKKTKKTKNIVDKTILF